ncbi:MAG: immunoglobulin-like domain-containing protein [Bacillota bacterium]
MKKPFIYLLGLTLLLLTSCDNRDPDSLTMTLNPSVDTIDVGTAYINPHVTVTLGNASYPYDIIENTLDITQVGRYHITYRTEYQDVVREITKTIDVVEPSSLDLTLNPGTDTIHVGDTYNDPGVTVTSAQDTSFNTTVSNPVDTQTEGTYIITYTATDDDGYTKTITRYVTVLP